MKCIRCQNNNNVLSCTIDDNGEHYSYNDEPAIIYDYGRKEWHNHGKLHRENAPAVSSDCGNYYQWWHEGYECIPYEGDIIDNIILLKYNLWNTKIKFDNKIAIILKHMKKYDNRVYFCLIENKKRFLMIKN